MSLYTSWTTTADNIRLLAQALRQSPADLISEAWELQPPQKVCASAISLERYQIVHQHGTTDARLLSRRIMECTACWEAFHIWEFEGIDEQHLDHIRMVGGTTKSIQ